MLPISSLGLPWFMIEDQIVRICPCDIQTFLEIHLCLIPKFPNSPIRRMSCDCHESLDDRKYFNLGTVFVFVRDSNCTNGFFGVVRIEAKCRPDFYLLALLAMHLEPCFLLLWRHRTSRQGCCRATVVQWLQKFSEKQSRHKKFKKNWKKLGGVLKIPFFLVSSFSGPDPMLNQTSQHLPARYLSYIFMENKNYFYYFARIGCSRNMEAKHY